MKRLLTQLKVQNVSILHVLPKNYDVLHNCMEYLPETVSPWPRSIWGVVRGTISSSLGRAWASPTVARTTWILVSVYVRMAHPTEYACAHTGTRVWESMRARTLIYCGPTWQKGLGWYKWDRPNSDCKYGSRGKASKTATKRSSKESSRDCGRKRSKAVQAQGERKRLLSSR